jgi:AmiR/NasT family two-component response regulator
MGRVLLASGSSQASELLSQLLKSAGYMNVITTSSGNEARRLVNQNDFELIVINTPLSDEFGHELSMMVAENTNAGIIVVCKADIADDLYDKVSYYGVCVLPKPLNKSLFFQSLKIVSATQSRIMGLRNENFKLQSKIEEIRLVNRAKCVLIQYLKLTEPQAHRYIEKQAMDTRQTKKDVAEKILKTYE